MISFQLNVFFIVLIIIFQVKCDNVDNKKIFFYQRSHTASNETFKMFNDYENYGNKKQNYAMDRQDSYFPINRPYQPSLKQEEPLRSSDCGGMFKNLQNLIQSPGHPNEPYPSNTFCEYTLRSPYVCNNDFHVQFLEFSLEPSKNCVKDYLKIGDDETLCGSVIGIKKYPSQNGVLRIRFKSDEKNNENGFKLLVTRLPCIGDGNPSVRALTTTEMEEIVETSTDGLMPDTTTIDYSLEIQHGHPYEKDTLHPEPIFKPASELLPPRGVIKNRQDIQPDFEDNDNGYLPPTTNSIPPSTGYDYPPPTNEWGPPKPYYPPSQPATPPPSFHCTYPHFTASFPANHNPSYYPQHPGYPDREVPVNPFNIPQRQDTMPPVLPPFYLPQCCRNVFHQQRFYLASNGFPGRRLPTSDCVYTIQKRSQYTCRLRISFKFFSLGDERFGCNDNFIEIDGQRICGCKTGLIYASQWGAGPKTIRVRTNGAVTNSPQGFVFDILQESCPYRYTGQPENNIRFKRHPFEYEVIPSQEITPKHFNNRPFASVATNSSSLVTYYHFGDGTPTRNIESPADFRQRAEGTSSQFFMPTYANNNQRFHCSFTYLDWFRLKAESLFIQRPGCLSL
jgi:hypothetical protein